MTSPPELSHNQPETRLNDLIASALDSSTDGFALYSANDDLIYCNQAFANLFGMDRSELTGLSHAQIIDCVAQKSHFINLDGHSVNELVHSLMQGWREKPLRSYEISSNRGGSFMITEQVTQDGMLTCISTDISQKRRIEKQLFEKDTLLQTILDYAPALISVKDNTGKILIINRYFSVIENNVGDDYIGKNMFDLLPKDQAQAIWNVDQEVINGKGNIEYEESYPHKDGSVHTYITHKFPLKNAEGEAFAVCSISTDITARKKAENLLTESEEQFRTIVDHAPEAIIIIDADTGKLIDANKNAESLTGLSREQLLNSHPSQTNPKFQANSKDSKSEARKQLIKALKGETPLFEWNLIHQSGQEVPCEVRLVKLPKKNKNLIRGSLIDISDRKGMDRVLERQRKHLHFLANHDPLTHLANRRLLQLNLDEAINQAKVENSRFAIMLIDLDRFKLINDTLGHHVGDEFLIVISKRLKELIRQGDTACRPGGDEFVVIFEHIKNRADIENKARVFLSELAQPVCLSGQELQTTLSIGIAMYPEHGDSSDTLLKHADVAMYKAKGEGKNNFEFYHQKLNDKLKESLIIENAMRRAIELKQFKLSYQPQMSLSDQRCFGVEVLLRWPHPEQGMISPVQFIPLAEETGLINAIGFWTLLTACEQFQQWQKQELYVETIAVNISARQFKHPDFINQIDHVLRQTGIPPKALQLELTESIVMEDAEETIEKLNQLSSFGISLALDDFGTGYSSLSYLKRFPIQKLKIDQSFVRDIATDQNDAAIVKSIIALAASMNLEVIAEGVESTEQLNFLTTNGCDQIQGYLFSKPLFADEFEAFFTANMAQTDPELT